MSLRDTRAEAGMLVMIWLFESACFPMIFALSVRGLGIYSKDASKWQVSSAGAGAIFPGVYYAVMRSKGGNAFAARYAMCVPLALFATAVTYPAYLSLRPRERKRTRRVPLEEMSRSRRRRLSIEMASA